MGFRHFREMGPRPFPRYFLSNAHNCEGHFFETDTLFVRSARIQVLGLSTMRLEQTNEGFSH